MSNSYYNFAPVFVSGTTVKAAPVNAQFTAVQSGFALVETASKTAIKLSGYSSSSAITATPSSFLQLNASGIPYASATVGFSPSFGGNRLQNVGNATVGTDAPSYGQMTAYIATIAFGSPNVLTVPAFAGNSLKNLRLNVGETALEFSDSLPSTTGTGESLSSVAGVPTWTRSNTNLLSYSSMDWMHDYGLIVPYPGWTVGTNVEISTDDSNNSQLGVVQNGSAIGSSQDIVQTSVAYAPTATAGAVYTASVDFACKAASANKVLLFVRFYDVSNAVIGSDTTLNISATTDNVMRRYAVQATAPALASYAVVGLKCNAAIGSAAAFRARLFQFELGSTPSLWSDTKTARPLENYMGTVAHEETGTATTVGIGVNAFNTSTVEWRSKASGAGYNVRARARAGGTVDGDGTLDWTCKKMIFGKVAGFAAVYNCGALGATETIDWYNGQKQKGTVDANTTITLTAPDSDIVLDGLRLMLQNNATGGYTTAFTSAATIKWKGNVAPTMPTAASAEMEVTFFWDGTRFLGSWAAI